MPAILRIFPYQTDASLVVLGQCGSYDQGVVLGDSMVCLQHYEVETLVGECAYAVMKHEASGDHHSCECQGLCERMFHRRYLFLMYWAMTNRQPTAIQNR